MAAAATPMQRIREGSPDAAEGIPTGADGALTAQEPRLARVLGDDGAAAGSPRCDGRAMHMERMDSGMRPAASGELDARERGVAVWASAERAASWPTAAHKCARPAPVLPTARDCMHLQFINNLPSVCDCADFTRRSMPAATAARCLVHQDCTTRWLNHVLTVTTCVCIHRRASLDATVGGSAKRPSIELVAVASGDLSAGSVRRRQRSGELPPPPPLLLGQHYHDGSSAGEPPSSHGTPSCPFIWSVIGHTNAVAHTYDPSSPAIPSLICLDSHS